MLNKLSLVKSKAYASLTAFALAVLVPSMAFADYTALETGAKTQIDSIAATVGTIGIAVLAIVGAIAAVNVVMRMLKKS